MIPMTGAQCQNFIFYVLTCVRRPAVLVALLLLVPLIFGSPLSPREFDVGLPRVFSGDEPHYLVMLNSVLSDGDLDVANNYIAAHRGGLAAGRAFAGQPLDHHTVWYEGAMRRHWKDVYELASQKWDRDAEGFPVPRLRPGQAAPQPDQAETSQHSPGLALMLAPLLLPLRGTDLVEPAAILCSALAMIVGMLMFRSLLKTWTTRPLVVDAVTAVTFLATPVWHYARSLFNESFMLMFATAAYSLTLRGRSPVIAGTAIALGMLMKPTFLLLALPLLALHLYERNLRGAIVLALPLAAAVAVTLSLNAALLGAPWRPVQEWQQGSPFSGAFGIFFSPKYGLLITAPAIIVAFAAWPRFLRSFRRDASVLLAGAALQFVLFANYKIWWSGASYSLRYMVPVLPMIFAALVCVVETHWWRSRAWRSAVVVICVVSFAINARAAIQYWNVFGTNPLYEGISGLSEICLNTRAPTVNEQVTSDPPGNVWHEEEDAWIGVWTRRAGTNVFDAIWTLGNEMQVKATLSIARAGDKVIVTRTNSSDNNDMTYVGTVCGSKVHGRYPGGRWFATIQ